MQLKYLDDEKNLRRAARRPWKDGKTSWIKWAKHHRDKKLLATKNPRENSKQRKFVCRNSHCEYPWGEKFGRQNGEENSGCENFAAKVPRTVSCLSRMWLIRIVTKARYACTLQCLCLTESLCMGDLVSFILSLIASLNNAMCYVLFDCFVNLD